MNLHAPLLTLLLGTLSATGVDPQAIADFVGRFPAPVCAARVVRDLVTTAGDASGLVQLPRAFEYCLSHYARPVAPACANA